MKKQLLIIMSIIFLALFANVSRVSAASCVGTGFNPSAGVDYKYFVNIAGPGYTGVGGTYRWYVTQSTDLINGTILTPADGFFEVLTGGGLSTYNSSIAAGTSDTLGLKWTENANTLTFYLVLKYREHNGNSGTPGCEAENIRVWEIKPNISTDFLLAIAPYDINGGMVFADTTLAKQCAADLTGAQINTTTTPISVAISYDTNTLYYQVTASGATGVWTPSIYLPALATPVPQNQNYASVQWRDLTVTPAVWYNFTGAAGSTGGLAQGYPSSQTAPVSLLGTSILVKVEVANNYYETLEDQTIRVGIDGVLPTGQDDIWGPGTWPGNPLACDPATNFAKKAPFKILARPEIQTGMTTQFIQKLP